MNRELAHPVTALNFLKDVNARGTLTLSDLLLVNRAGHRAARTVGKLAVAFGS